MRTILADGASAGAPSRPAPALVADRATATASAAFPATSDAPVVVVERRSLIRECLAACIAAQSGQHVITFADLEACLASPEAMSASLLVLCDPSEQTTRDVEHLVLLMGRLPVVILSDGEELDQILRVIRHGVRGYIPTSLSLPVMIEALRLVRAGGTFVPAQSVVTGMRSGEPDGRGERADKSGLTARQQEVVAAIGRGKANKEIARDLNMSESTVKVHVRRIMKKLSATNRTKVALMASSLLGGGPRALPSE